MRIRKLDLTRYGKFTDQQLTFGPVKPGVPDLHIVYGANEAGKSTAFSAWLDLLFGIPAQSPYNFKHPYSTMRIGAELEIEGQPISFARIKGKQNTLLNASGMAMPDSVLQAGLGAVDRNGYAAMFSLNEDTLAKGGEGILASQGDLGQLLFSASAGLAELGGRLEKLRGQSTEMRAKGGRLAQLKSQLEALDERRKAIDMQAGEYARLVDARERAVQVWEASKNDHAKAAAAAEDVRRCLAALVPFNRLKRIRAELEPLSDVPVPPPEWAARMPVLQRQAVDLTARIEEADTAIARFETTLAALHPDLGVLALKADISAAETLKGAHDTALQDLPNRRDSAQDVVKTIDQILGKLGQSGRDPQELIIDGALQARLRKLIERRSGVDASLDTARAEAAQAVAAAEKAHELLADAGGSVQGTQVLAGLLGDLRQRAPSKLLRDARLKVNLAQQTLSARLASLAPWVGTAADLQGMAVPGARQLSKLEADLEHARQAEADSVGLLHRVQQNLELKRATLGARMSAEPVSVGDAAAARSLREQLWAAHRAKLDAGSAAAFEQAMRQDDQVTARQASAISAAEAREDLALLQAEHGQVETAASKATKATAQLVAQLGALITSISPALPEGWSLAELHPWLALRLKALEANDGLAAAQAEAEAAVSGVEEARLALFEALATAGAAKPSDAAYDVLVAEAHVLAEAGIRLEGLQQAAVTADRAMARRQQQLAEGVSASETWQTEWAALCRTTWLAEAGLPDALSTSAILGDVEALDRAVAEQRSLADRIQKMEKNQSAFLQALGKVAAKLGLDAGTEPGFLWQQITFRLKQAEDDLKDQTKATTELAALRASRAELDGTRAKLQAEIGGMANFFGVTADELSAKMAESDLQQRLQAERLAAEHEAMEALGTGSVAEVETQLQGLDRGVLDYRRISAEGEAKERLVVLQEHFAAMQKATDQLSAVGGDDAVARIEEARQTMLLELEDTARQYLRLRLGILSVDHALRAYREGHRSAMMLRASQAFSTISRGAYSGLASQLEKDREVLVAKGQDGTSKMAQDLSTGARFQLYLALRVAGYHEFAQTRTPMPFIADDIMETFDDDRSAEAFGLLTDMARQGQVIYLTHHRHLCTIAREVCPGVIVHELG